MLDQSLIIVEEWKKEMQVLGRASTVSKMPERLE
jgi:hypothetical protein